VNTTLKLYIKSGCPWCIKAAAYLDSHGYTYQEIEVRSDAAAFAEMKKISGQTYAPTLAIGDLVLADFDTDELAAFFSKHDIQPS